MLRGIYRSLCCMGLLLFFVSFTSADDMTMTGTISDSTCRANHGPMMHYHPDAKNAHDCTVACVKGGARYVFAGMDGKVYDINNQGFADLEAHAGDTVQLTGNVNGMNVTVSKIAASH
jgi:hypothetical protein